MASLVSVIIAAYNHEAYIQETINSIIKQSYSQIELVIVDDGSTDTTYEKILELKNECEKRFIRFHVEKQKNVGLIETIKKLVMLSNGDYVYCIASDDLALPNAISLQTDFLENNLDYALVVGDNEIIDQFGQRIFWDKNRRAIYKKSNITYDTFADFLKIKNKKDFGRYLSLYKGNHIPNGYLIRKSIFEKVHPYTKEAPLEDWFLHLQISKYAKMKFIDEILFSYRWHDTNTAKNIEKMENLTLKTRLYEDALLQSLDLQLFKKNVQLDIKDCLIYGKNTSLLVIIPNILEIRKIKKTSSIKGILIRIFGIDILISRR